MPTSKAQSSGGQANAVKSRQLAIAEYLSAPRICKYCSEPIQVRDGEKVSEIRRRTFCNHHCAASHTHLVAPRPRAPKPPPKPRKKRLRNITKGDLFQKRSGWQSARSSIRQDAYKTYEESGLPLVCICGYSKHVEICHKQAVSLFPDTATMIEINNLANLLALCPNCHWEFDNGLLKLVAANGLEPLT